MKFIKYVIIGFITGIVNGLFGSGGGTIVVPALIIFLCMEEHKAHATAIAIILPLTIVSAFFYLKSDFVNIPLTLRVSIGGIVGGYLGAKILNSMPERTLRIVFGSFMILAASRMVF